MRITEGASLYALCRSWLKNGVPEESQVTIALYENYLLCSLLKLTVFFYVKIAYYSIFRKDCIFLDVLQPLIYNKCNLT